MIRIVYNMVGIVCVAAGILAGIVASGLMVKPSIAFAVGAGVAGLADFAYRWRKGGLDQDGGMIWYIPVWILGVAFAAVSTLFIVLSATGALDYK